MIGQYCLVRDPRLVKLRPTVQNGDSIRTNATLGAFRNYYQSIFLERREEIIAKSEDLFTS